MNLFDFTNWYLNECQYDYFNKYVNKKIYNLCSKYLFSNNELTNKEYQTLINFFNQHFKTN